MSRPAAAGLTCCECSSSFTRSSNLYRHYRLQHDLEVVATTRSAAGGGGAAVVCAHCPRRFSKRANMLRHYRSAHRVDSELENKRDDSVAKQDQKEVAKTSVIHLNPTQARFKSTDANLRLTEVNLTTAEGHLNPADGNSTPTKADTISMEETYELSGLTDIMDAVLRMAEELDAGDLDLVLDAATKLNETTRRLADGRVLVED